MKEFAEALKNFSSMDEMEIKLVETAEIKSPDIELDFEVELNGEKIISIKPNQSPAP